MRYALLVLVFWSLAFAAGAEEPPTYLAGYDPVRHDEAGPLLNRTLSRQYGVPEERVGSLRGRGMRWREVEFTLAVAARAGRDPDEIAAHWKRGVPWEEIALRYGFALDDAVPIPPAAETVAADPYPEEQTP